MSVQNGERFMRLLEQQPELRARLRDSLGSGDQQGVEAISAEVGASCRACEVVAALLQRLDAAPSAGAR